MIGGWKSKPIVLVLLLSCISLTKSVSGGVIFSTFGPGDSFALSGEGVSGPSSSVGAEIFWGAAFTPTSDASLGEIDVAFIRSQIPSDSPRFQLSLYGSDVSGKVGALIDSFAILDAPSTRTIISTTASDHPELLVGTKYWLIAKPADSNSLVYWWLSSPTVTGDAYASSAGPDNYISNYPLPAFRLLSASAVPEPSSIVLSLIGVVTLSGYYVRRRRT